MTDRALRAALIKLDQGRSNASEFTPAQRRALEALMHRTGCIRAERRGRGLAYQVVNRPVFERQLSNLRPEAQAQTPVKRAGNLAQTRSTKGKAHGHDTFYQLVRAAGAPALWRNHEGGNQDQCFDLWPLTQAAGALAIELHQAARHLYSDSPLWLVENQALFDDTTWVPPAIGGSVLFYSGQLPAKLLHWLADAPRAPRILCFPDYDGIGLQNYGRLYRAIGHRAEFWLMPGWEEKLHKYGSARIWQNTLASFGEAERVLSRFPLPDELVSLIGKLKSSGLALEQEAVFLES